MKKLLFLGLFLSSFSCSEPKSDTKASVPQVTAMEVKKEDAPVTSEFVAVTQSSHMVNIQARVNGFLDQRVYTEGEIVKKDQILFVMDKKPFIAQVEAAKAALESRKAVRETAKLNLDRTRPLTKLNALSQKDLDDAIGQYDSAVASVHEAEANLLTAELNLSYCTIRSPLDGITSAALEQDGTYLSFSNNQLTTVSQLDPIWVNFSLSEIQMANYRNQVKKGLIVPPKDDAYDIEVVLIDGQTYPYQGKITFTEPYFNPQTGTFLIRASVKNPEALLRPNQYVKAIVKGSIRPNSISIPQRAVMQSSKGHYVWTLKDKNTVEFRPIEVGDWQGENWFINEGLFPGDIVVVDGGQNLSAQEKVDAKILH
ncbi:MAG: efflux RND transporter periplasmic adaptor subunit [Chlamydiia bacterium]|nr:efflux RND transporter periplasmic adaptor subunit [Chlamydiia bacterium]